MKKIYLILISILLTTNSFTQQNGHPESFKCKHGHTYRKSEQKSNPALMNYDVKFYKLDIEATTESTAIEGSTKILATVGNEALSEFVIEITEHINIDSVFISDNKVEFTRNKDELSVNLSNNIAANTDFTATIYYRRPASAVNYTSGIYNSAVSGWDKKVTFTLSEPYHAKSWFACKQVLEDKADSTHIFITIDENLKAGANGLLKAVTPMGNGKVRYEWKSNYPIAYYLLSIAVSDYTEYNIYAKPTEMGEDSLLIQNYLYNNYSGVNAQKAGIDATVELMELFSDKYTLYPFSEEKYGHCYAPLGGAMEHQTMTTTGSHLFYIIAHELGHQWFGDNVTCGTWQDIWINEGFASYSEYLAFEYLSSQNDANEWVKAAQEYARQSPTGSVYIPFNEVMDDNRIFSWSLTYRKGLCLVHMIRNELNNDDLFFSILRDFQTEFKDDVAIGEDFKTLLFEKSSIDFTAFFNEWYYGEGFPTYNAEWSQFENNVKITVNQTTSASSTPLFSNTMDYKLNYNEGDTIIRIKQTENPQTFNINFSKPVISIQIDPESWILKSEASSIVGIKTSKHNLNATCFPNPVKNILNITSVDEQIKEITILDISGRIVLTKMTDSKSETINIKDLKTGTYFLQISGTERKSIKKIIKE